MAKAALKKETEKVKAKLIVPVTRREDAYGTVRYTRASGVLHRDDGPAVIMADGQQEWIQNGRHHREDGPAIITALGDHYWMQNGNYHREDGPALIYNRNTGQKPLYYLEGQNINEKRFHERIKHNRMCKALESLERFSDKYGKGKQLEGAGAAVMKFLQGACDHTFKTKTEECELCSSN